MNKNNTIAVIGAGVIGITTALQLQSRGYQVTLFDKSKPASACSQGNAGHFATEQVFPMADSSLLWKLPKMLFDPIGPLRIDLRSMLGNLPWFWRFLLQMPKSRFNQGVAALSALNQAALPAYQRLLKQQYAELIESQGSLLVCEKQQNLDVLFNKYHRQGISVIKLNSQQTQQLEPNLAKHIAGALYFDQVGHSMDPYRLCQRLYQHFIAAGGTFKNAEIDRIETTNSRPLLKTSEQSFGVFDHVVIATGAWGKSLCQQLGYRLPLIAERGYHTMVKDPEVFSRPVASSERGFIMTPMQMGLRLAGTVEFANVDSPPNYHRARALFRHAQTLVDLPLVEQQEQIWVGVRPTLPDYLPVIGQAPKHDSIYFALGHQHLGLTQAAITSECIADLIDKKPNDIDLTPFSISRFA
ncbi:MULTISPECIES: NAD(P)/FAD-dependent oxidoreductase [unclassified Pseudoalteromonas]|uniref:NAD(P)/FAD-dependent oxidoreductase n=1 Tax=unclassified Pseudoalteromonas TaxID=194690 RepID=UPI003014C636